MLDAARRRLRLALKPKARSGQRIDDRRKIVRLRGDDKRVAAALGEGCKHAPRRCIATHSLHVLIDGEQLHDVVTWLEDCAQPSVVGKIDEVYARRNLDRAEDHPRGVELRLRAVNGVDKGRTELGDLVGQNADIAARVENGLAAVVHLAGEEILEPLAPGAADPRAHDRRLNLTSRRVVHASDMVGRAGKQRPTRPSAQRDGPKARSAAF